MPRIERDILASPQSPVMGDPCLLEEDLDGINAPLDHDRVMGIRHRDRVVVAIEADERETIGGRRDFPARVKGGSGQLKKGGLVFF